MAQVFDKLYINVRGIPPEIITAVQGDTNSRFLDVYLKDNSLPLNLTGHEVRIYGVKGDSTEFYNEGEITEAENGRCQFELTSQALAVAHDISAQIVIFYDNVQILQTLPFTIHVVKSLVSSNAIESSNEYGALVVLYQNLYEAYDLMTTMVQNQGVKSSVSTDRDINTFWQVMEYVTRYLDTDLTDLLNYVLENADVIGVINRLGETTDTGGTATTGTVFGKLNNLISSIGVKSIQRGYLNSGESDINITINTVNPAKCFVILNNGYLGGSNPTYGTYLRSITATNLSLNSNYYYAGSSSYISQYISWQVIEFY